jgi:hypothetical protein
MSKKLVATLLTATLVITSVVPAIASGVDGAGKVEYDNSKAVAYDSVTFPTLTGSKYDFEIDPAGLLHTYDADTYGTGSVYFASISTHESLVPKSGVTLYKKIKSVHNAADNKWSGIVKTATTNAETGAITVTALNEGFFVWIPADFTEADSKNGITTVGKKGEYEELTSSNFTKWFKVVETSDGVYDLTLLNNYKSGTDVCSGVVYKTDYEEIPAAGIVEAAGSAVSVEDYATISGGKVSAYTNVYKKAGTGAEDDPVVYTMLAADSEDMVYTPEEITKNGSTDSVDITNKSTREKTVTAVITMSNADDLTFKSANSYETDEAATSVYFAAMGGSTPVPLEKSSDGVVSATFTTTIAGRTGDPDITYQTTGTNDAGGHNYARYEAANVTYTTKGFYLTASANTDAKAKDAWIAWAKGITSETRPSINIVYTVKNTPTPEEAEAAAETAAIEAANAFKTTYATILAKTAETVTYDDLAADNGITAALTAYAGLDEAVKAKLTSEKALLDSLKTAAEAKAITDAAAYGLWDDTTIWLAKASDAGFEGDTVTVQVTKDGSTWVTLDSSKYTYDNDKWIQVEYANIASAAGGDPTITSYIRVIDGTTRYTFTDE